VRPERRDKRAPALSLRGLPTAFSGRCSTRAVERPNGTFASSSIAASLVPRPVRPVSRPSFAAAARNFRLDRRWGFGREGKRQEGGSCSRTPEKVGFLATSIGRAGVGCVVTKSGHRRASPPGYRS
jgi:hypothetical protein